MKKYFLLIIASIVTLTGCKASDSVDTLVGSSTQDSGGGNSTPYLVSAPSTGTYSSVTVNSSQTQSFYISNVSTKSSTISSVAIVGSRFSVANDLCTGSTLVNGTGVCTLDVVFSPVAAGSFSGSVVVTLSGGSTLTIPLIGTAVTQTPSLVSSPVSGAFGTVTLGSNVSFPLSITNTSGLPATVGVSTVSGSVFTITSNTCDSAVIPNNGSCAIVVRFTPAAATAYAETLTIPYVGPNSVSYSTTVAFTGIGAAAAVPPTLAASPSTKDFGNVATNVTTTQTFTVTNTSGVTAITQTGSITGSAYTITATTCNGVTISAGGTCSITVRFAPSSITSFTGTLSLPYTAATGGSTYTMNASLTGAGVAPSVSFAFNGFNLGVGSHTTSLTGTGVVLTWSAPTGGSASYFKIFKTIGGTTTATSALSGSSTSYNVTGLTPNTTTTFRINAYDSLDVSDGNLNTIDVTTPNVTGATFNGWSDVVATGDVTSSIGSIDDALGYSSTGRLSNNLAVTLSGTSGPAAKVKIAWEDFTFTPTATATSYNVYRSTTSGSGFALVGTSASAQYTDSTVSSNTKYYYKVYPVVASELVPAVTADTEIDIYVPPSNMSLVHRWMTNRETCVNLLSKTWPADIDRTDNYSCAYNWGLGFGPSGGAQKTKWDMGYSFFVDRWGGGCKMTATGPVYGSAAPAGGSNGDVYFKNGGSTASEIAGGACYTKKAGVWYEYNSISLLPSDRNAMVTNEPGYPGVATDQAKAYYTCQQRNIAGVGPLRMLRIQEFVAAGAWNGVFQNYTSTQINNLETGVDHPSNRGCNSSFAQNVDPLDAIFFRKTGRQFISGSYASANCKSRYEIQDLIGNLPEWMAEQTNFCNSATTCTGITSTLDSGANIIDGLLFNGTMGMAAGSYTTYINAIPMLAMPTVSVSSTLGSVLFTSRTNFDSYFLYFTGGGISGLHSGWYVNPISRGNNNGRFTWSHENYGITQVGWGGSDIGMRCVGTAP